MVVPCNLTAAHDTGLGVLDAASNNGLRVNVTLAVLVAITVLILVGALALDKLLVNRLRGLSGKHLGAVTVLNISLHGVGLLGGGQGTSRTSGRRGGARGRDAVGADRVAGIASILGSHRSPGHRGGRGHVAGASRRSTLLGEALTSSGGINKLESLLIDSELNRGGSSLCAQVVHASLETQLPASEVHAGNLAHGRIAHVDVEGLGLIDKGTTVSGHLDNLALRNLPDSLVQSLDIGRDVGNVLDRTVLGNNAVLHGIRPETHVDKVLEQPGVDNLELTSQDTALVDVGGVGLEAFVVAKNLRGTGSRHGSNQKRVAETVLLNLLAELIPLPEARGLDIPHVKLKDALRGRGTLEGLVGTLLLGKLHGGGKSSVVDSLKDLLVELAGLGRLERHAQSKEGISKTLNTNTDRAVAHVAVASLGDGVVVDINDAVQVANNNHSDVVKLLKVVDTIGVVHVGGKGQRGQVAYSSLIGSTVLDDLSAQIGAADGAKVLLVALAVAGILVKHEGVTSLSLGLQDGIPKLLSLDSLAAFALSLILLVESLKFLAIAVGKARALVGAHQSPLAVLLNTLHEQIRDP